MSTAAERKAAKDAYIAALQSQRAANPALPTAPSAPSPRAGNVFEASVLPSSVLGIGGVPLRGSSSEGPRDVALSSRDKMLEERRQQFFARQKGQNGSEQETKAPPSSSSQQQYQHEWQQQQYQQPQLSIKPPQLQMPEFSMPPSPKLKGPPMDQNSNYGLEQQIAPSNPKLSHYQKHGYASEYAYAQALGQLEIRKPKPQQQEQLYPESLQQPYPPSGNYHGQYEQKDHQSNPLLARPQEPSGGGGLADLGGKQKTQHQRQQEQKEFARLLDQDQHKLAQMHAENQATKNLLDGQQAQAAIVNENFAGDYRDNASIKAAKKDKQNEYAQQLQQQQAEHKLINNEQNSHKDIFGVGINSIGQFADNERAMKREKQAEYFRALEQQQRGGQMQERGSVVANHVVANDMNDAGVGDFMGTKAEDIAAKKQKQQEYAMALQQQQMWRQMNQRTEDSRDGVGIQMIGANSSKDDAKKQKEDYVRFLDMQIHAKKDSIVNNRGNRELDITAGVGVNGIGGDSEAKKKLKRDKQAEYAWALQQQQLLHQLAEQQKQQNVTTNGTSSILSRPSQLPPPQSLQPPQSFAHGAHGGLYDDPHEVALKKAKQAQYAQMLQQQQLLQQQAQNKELEQHQSKKPVDPNISLASRAAEGWVIGPLGVPVRKTIEVGNRGVQRAYYQGSPQKPTTSIPSDPFQYNQQQQQFQMAQSHIMPQQPLHQPQPQYSFNNIGIPGQELGHGHEGQLFPAYLGPMGMPMENPEYPPPYGNAPGSVLALPLGGGNNGGAMPPTSLGGEFEDERTIRARKLQLEQARALEEQIRQNKQRIDAERRKREADEAKEAERIEKERFEMQRAYEKEISLQKQKTEDENRRLLELQIVEKKRQKEEEERLEREREAKENERLRLEQEQLKRKNEEEIRREKVLQTSPHTSPPRGKGIVVPPVPQTTLLLSPRSLKRQQETFLFGGAPSPTMDRHPVGMKGKQFDLFDGNDDREMPPNTIRVSPSITSFNQQRANALRNDEDAREEMENMRRAHQVEQERRQQQQRQLQLQNDQVLSQQKSQPPKKMMVPLTPPKPSYRAVDDDEIFKLDRTLEGESKFVFPDGSAFVPKKGMVPPPPENNKSFMNLSDLKDVGGLVTNVPPPNPPNGGLNIGAKLRQHIRRKGKESSDGGGNVPSDETNENAKPAEYDVDRLLRLNRRKWELLKGLDGQQGVEELDLLLHDLDGISSRPSSAATSRPGTIPHDSRFTSLGGEGYGANMGWGVHGADDDNISPRDPWNRRQTSSSSRLRSQESEYFRNRESGRGGDSARLLLAGRAAIKNDSSVPVTSNEGRGRLYDSEIFSDYGL